MGESTEVGGHPESLVLSAQTDKERTAKPCLESSTDFWEQAGGRGLDTWHPLPDWCAFSRQSSDGSSEESPYSFVIDDHFAAPSAEEANDHRMWLRRIFETIRP